MSLPVTPPDKIFYYNSERLDYTGCKVTAVYWDGSTKDVTDKVTFDPTSGSYVDTDIEKPYYEGSYDGPHLHTEYIRTNTQVVTITYAEVDEVAASNITSWNPNYDPEYDDPEWEWEPVSNNSEGCNYWAERDENGNLIFETPDYWDENRQFHYGTTTYHTRLKYLDTSDGQMKEATFSISGISIGYNDGKSGGGNLYIEIVPGGSGESYSDDIRSLSVPTTSLSGIEERNGQLGWVLTYSLELYDVIPEWNYYTYLVGAKYVGEEFIPFMAIQHQSQATYELNLSVFGLHELLISPPTKTKYHSGEQYDFTGLVCTAVYTDGSTEDVTSSVIFAPDIRGRSPNYGYGNDFVYGEAVEYIGGPGWRYPYWRGCYDRQKNSFIIGVTYRNTSVYDGVNHVGNSFTMQDVYLSEITVTPPSKATYQSGETIDYSGAVVTATYSDGSTEIVTSSAIFSPAAGTTITSDTTVSVSYTNAWSETATANFSLTVSTENY